MQSRNSFLRQLSERREAWESASNRWVENTMMMSHSETGFETEYNRSNAEGCFGNFESNNGGGGVMRKRVMVLVDESTHSKHAMMWALTHMANKGDLFTLLHVIPSSQRISETMISSSSDSSSSSSSSSSSFSPSGSPLLANSLGSLCKACKPEVEVEALVIQGPKLSTILNQVKKLEVSVLVLGQKKPSSLFSCFCGTSRSEELVERCIESAECLTIGVRKQSRGVSGYLISTRWQKNFWLLA